MNEASRKVSELTNEILSIVGADPKDALSVKVVAGSRTVEVEALTSAGKKNGGTYTTSEMRSYVCPFTGEELAEMKEANAK